MSSEKIVLKQLLLNLLDERLNRLEKRNIEEVKDLKNSKLQYKKQTSILTQLTKKVSENNKKVSFNHSLKNNSELIKHKVSQNPTKLKLSPKYYQKQNNNKIRNALTPTRPISIYSLTTENWMQKRSNKYNYVKSRYMDETNNITKSNAKKFRDNGKLFLTPEPHFKKKKYKNRINIKPKKLNHENIDINAKKNINTVKREKIHEKKTMISDIDLGSEEIIFVLKELKKDKERKDNNSEEENENEDKNSKNKSKSSNSSDSSTSSNKNDNEKIYKAKNKEILVHFGKYINSSEGDKVFMLISSFLDKKTKYNFFSCSKKSISHLLFELNNKYNYILDMNKITSINSIEDEINNLKNKYKDEDFDSPKYSFKLSKGSIKALEILDGKIYNDIFKTEVLNPPLNEIILIYRIFFQLINKEELIEIENDKKFWKESRNYILEKNNSKIGSFIKECVGEFDFTKENIYKLKKLSAGKEEKLRPTNYENICKTTGLVAFVVKDSLEYCGIIQNTKKIMPGVFISYLEYIQDNLEKCKEYIDFLKSYG